MSIKNFSAIKVAFPEQEIDKLIALYEGSFTANAGTSTTYSISISSPQSTACLPELLWSIDGGTTWQIGGMLISGNLGVTVGVSASTAKFYAEYFLGSGGPNTITYKLYLIWPT